MRIRRRYFRRRGLSRKENRRQYMTGVQGSDLVLICIYTKKTLRRLRVAILETQKEKEVLHDDREKKDISVRHETHYGTGLMTLEIQFRLRRSSLYTVYWLQFEIISLS